MTHWSIRALVALSVAVACAKATDEELLKGGDDDTGGSSGKGGSGGTAAVGGSPFGGAAGRGGASTGGSAGAGKGGIGGSGGTSGAAGANDGGASDGGAGPDPCSVSGTPPDLRVDYKSGTRPVMEDPEGAFHIVNETSQAIPLSELRARYWFHSEFTCDETTAQMAVNVVHQQFDRPYATMAPTHVTKRVVELGSGAPGCDAYFEIGFAAAAGSLAPNQMAVVQYYASIPIYEAARPKNQANDYSFGACTSAFVYWDKIALYRNGRLVSGSEPGGGGGEGGQGGAPNGGQGGA